MNPITLFALMLKASLFSFSGMGNVPSLHDDLLARNWTTEKQFADSLAVGQVSPGPNGLWAISLGYLMDGLRGALLALVAISLPPMLVLAVGKLYARVKHHPAVEGFVRGLSLAVVGVFAIVMLRLLQGVGLNGRSLGIMLAAIGVGSMRRIPVAALLAVAAIAGLLLFAPRP